MKHQKMKSGYRKFSYVTDIGGIMNAIGEMRGLGFPKQPLLNKRRGNPEVDSDLNEEWFIKTITEKVASHLCRTPTFC